MIEELVEALKNDKEFYDVYKANIAMAFIDEYGRCEKRYKNREDIHRISNRAAENFLNLLMK
jgi:hypothetical protein